MAPDAQLEIVSKVPLFTNLNKKHLKAISESGKKLSFAKGEKIVGKGDTGDSLYVVLDGRVEARSGEKVLAKLGKGKFFGEIALFDKQPRSADIIAVSPTTCLRITGLAFERTLQKEPKIVHGVMMELAQRLRNADMALTE